MNNLTAREAEVVALLATDGPTSKQIARSLGIAETTVDTHTRTACRKLGAKNRMHAALIWDRIVRERDRINAQLCERLGAA